MLKKYDVGNITPKNGNVIVYLDRSEVVKDGVLLGVNNEFASKRFSDGQYDLRHYHGLVLKSDSLYISEGDYVLYNQFSGNMFGGNEGILESVLWTSIVIKTDKDMIKREALYERLLVRLRKETSVTEVDGILVSSTEDKDSQHRLVEEFEVVSVSEEASAEYSVGDFVVLPVGMGVEIKELEDDIYKYRSINYRDVIFKNRD